MNNIKLKQKENEINKRPDFIETDEELEEYFEYLDNLRKSGETNMFGAGSYIQVEFGIDEDNARKVLAYWMNTFGERHPR
jgi:hypothetical protein